MAALDLDRVRVAVENLLLDEITATSGRVDVSELDFDEVTGEYAQPTPAVIYQGPGAVTGRTGSSTYGGLTAVGTPDGDYRLIVPLAAPGLPVGTEITAPTARDVGLRERKYQVVDNGTVGTYSVLRAYGLEEIIDGQEVPVG